MDGLEQPPDEIRSGEGNEREDHADQGVLRQAGVKPDQREGHDLRCEGDDVSDRR